MKAFLGECFVLCMPVVALAVLLLFSPKEKK